MSKRRNTLTVDAMVSADVIVDNVVNFACSVITCERTDGRRDDVPPGWVVHNLIKRGALAYYVSETPMEGFLYYMGKNAVGRYGVPQTVKLSTGAMNSPKQISVPASVDGSVNTAVILPANELMKPPIFTIKYYAQIIATLDACIKANTLASSRSQILYGSAKQVEGLELIIETALQGLPTVIETEFAESIGAVNIAVPFIGNEYAQLRQGFYIDLMKQFGAITPTQFKAERVQSAELWANAGESIDNVYVMIDSFNRAAERGNVPYRLVYTGYGARYDTDGDQEPADQTEPEPDVSQIDTTGEGGIPND